MHTPANRPPVAVGDTATTNEDTAVNINVLANDGDPDNDPLTITITSAPAKGTVAVNNNGTPDNPADDFVTYTPNPNVNGTDGFTYQVNDGHGGIASASVTIRVNPINHAPVANDDSAVTETDSPVAINVLANDTDADQDALTVTSVTQGTHGTVAIGADGTLTYGPSAGFHGTDAFTYTVSDSQGGSATATVSITVNVIPLLQFSLRETLSVPAGFDEVVGFTDLDGNGSPEAVLRGPTSLNILQPDGTSLVNRFTVSQSPLRGAALGEVNGQPEVLSADNDSITVHDAAGNNAYQVVHQASYGPFLEGSIRVGDSNGNGKPEFLIPQGGSPSRVHVLEGSGNNTYVDLGSVTGDGGNAYLAGVGDLNGNGVPAIVFQDDGYSSARRTYVYENGALVYQNNNLAALGVGDTDGNGRAEIIGLDPATGNLKILESNGNNTFTQVLSSSLPFGNIDSHSFVQDVDGDGRAELLRTEVG